MSEAKAAERRFPIQDGPSVPWSYMEPHDAQCRKNHGGQSLDHIASRGGLGAAEAELVVTGEKWNPRQDVGVLIERWYQRAEKVNREWSDATHSELEQLRERNDFLATMLAGADATMFELEQVIPRNESDRDYSETVTKAFESLRERVRELEAENRSEQMRHTGGMLSMVFDEQSLTADLTTANQRIAELEAENRQLQANVGGGDTAISQLEQAVDSLTTQLTAANEKCERLERERCRKFRVTDGEREGLCYSFYDHFDVWWDNGEFDHGIMDLSYKGINKLGGES